MPRAGWDSAAVEPRTAADTATARNTPLDVKICDAQRIVLDELAPWLDHVAHQAREDFVGHVGLRDLDTKQRAVGRVQCRFPKLLGIHFAKTLVALDAETLASRG